jgi:hypothetical protein
MRDGVIVTTTQGLAMNSMRMMQKRLKNFEVSERKQVGDTASMLMTAQSGQNRFGHNDGEQL